MSHFLEICIRIRKMRLAILRVMVEEELSVYIYIHIYTLIRTHICMYILGVSKTCIYVTCIHFYYQYILIYITIIIQFFPFLTCVSMFLAPSIYAGKVAGIGWEEAKEW